MNIYFCKEQNTQIFNSIDIGSNREDFVLYSGMSWTT